MNDWQPIETAPKDTDPEAEILVAFVEPGKRKKPRGSWVCAAVYRHCGLWFPPNNYDDALSPQPTHWMPLPPPPQEPKPRTYDSTVARIAGNIAGHLIPDHIYDEKVVAEEAVALARAIVAEVERTEPTPPAKETPE